MSACNRYKFTKRLQKIFTTRGLNVVCKICDRPIQVGEEIESKQQSHGRLQIYHATCYDNSFIDV
jgi:hypothetical protein